MSMNRPAGNVSFEIRKRGSRGSVIGVEKNYQLSFADIFNCRAYWEKGVFANLSDS